MKIIYRIIVLAFVLLVAGCTKREFESRGIIGLSSQNKNELNIQQFLASLPHIDLQIEKLKNTDLYSISAKSKDAQEAAQKVNDAMLQMQKTFRDSDPNDKIIIWEKATPALEASRW